MRINWLDESSLTYEEAMELLNRSHNKRLEMEEKNKWDAYVNDFTFWTFLNDTYGYMQEEIEKEQNLDYFFLCYYFPMKLREFMFLETFLSNEKFKTAKQVLQLKQKYNIWEIVEEWWKSIFETWLN